MKVSHQFCVAASVLLLACLLQKTIMKMVADYEMFDDAPVTRAELLSRDSWAAWMLSRNFLFPSLFTIVAIVLSVIALVMVIRRTRPAMAPMAMQM